MLKNVNYCFFNLLTADDIYIFVMTSTSFAASVASHGGNFLKNLPAVFCTGQNLLHKWYTTLCI